MNTKPHTHISVLIWHFSSATSREGIYPRLNYLYEYISHNSLYSIRAPTNPSGMVGLKTCKPLAMHASSPHASLPPTMNRDEKTTLTPTPTSTSITKYRRYGVGSGAPNASQGLHRGSSTGHLVQDTGTLTQARVSYFGEGAFQSISEYWLPDLFFP